MDIEKKDLDAAVKAGALGRDEAERLWRFWLERKEAEPRLRLSHLPYYLGAVLVLGALGWFLLKAWLEFSGLVLLCTAISYSFLFFVGGLLLRGRRGWRVPGGLAVTVAVCMTPLALYGFLRYTGYWEAQAALFAAGAAGAPCHRLWLEGAAAAVSLLTARVVPFPFLFAPFGLALWLLAMDSLPLWRGWLPWVSELWLSAWLGGLLLLLASWVDGGRRRGGPDMAFWLCLASALSLAFGLYGLAWPEASAPHWTVLPVAAGFLLAALLWRRLLFGLCGAAGLLGYAAYAAYDLLGDSLYLPLALGLLGALALGGIWLCQRRWGSWRAGLLRILPAWVQRRLPPA